MFISKGVVARGLLLPMGGMMLPAGCVESRGISRGSIVVHLLLGRRLRPMLIGDIAIILVMIVLLIRGLMLHSSLFRGGSSETPNLLLSNDCFIDPTYRN